MACNIALADVSDAGDITIGTILLLCTALGVPANFVSFVYFYTLKARSSNGIFFKQVYTIITVVDSLVCTLTFPIIEVVFKQ